MPKAALQRWLTVYLLELRLTCLHWSYLVGVALWSAFVVITYTRDNFASVQGLFAFVMGFSSLIAMFLAGMQASRATRSRFDVLEVALPSGVEVLLARWLATITAVAGLLIAPLVVAALAPPGRLEWGTVARIVGLTLLSIAFATGLIWLVQNTVGIRRWMYPFFAVFWVAGGLLSATLNYEGLPVPGASLVNFITMNQFGDSMWGLLPQGQLPTWFLIFYVGVVILFAGVMLWRTIAARFYRRSLSVMALTLIALGVVLFAGVNYSTAVYAANQQVLDEDQHVQDRLGQVVLPEEMPFAVTAYDLTFALGTPSRLSAAIEVINRSAAPITELLFSLYQQFEIVDASVPFTRGEGTLTLTLPQALAPGEVTQVSVTYEGNIQYFERRLGRPPETTYFIDPNGVYLACATLWYPIPGSLLPNISDYDRDFHENPQCLLDTPARFRLTINEVGALHYASNLTQVDTTTFESTGSTWAQLLGAAQLETVTDGALTVVTTSNQLAELRPQVEQFYLPAFQHLQHFFPQVEHLTVLALDVAGDSFTVWENYPSTAESAIVTVEPRVFQWLPLNPQNEYDFVGARIVNSIFEQNTTLAENIAYFLWLHYRANGDTEMMRTLLEGGLPTGSIGRTSYYSLPYEERYQIAFALYDVYAAQGEAAIIELLREIEGNMAVLSGLSPAEVIAWIEEATNG